MQEGHLTSEATICHISRSCEDYRRYSFVLVLTPRRLGILKNCMLGKQVQWMMWHWSCYVANAISRLAQLSHGRISLIDCLQLISNSAFIDRKIKFRISGKANIALKHLRSQMTNLLACQFRGKPLSESQVLWNELAMMVLGKTKIEHDRDDDADRDGPIGPIVVIHSH